MGGWLCYLFDMQVWTLGRYVENELSKKNKFGRPMRKLNQILSDDLRKPKQVGMSAEGLIALFGDKAEVKDYRGKPRPESSSEK